MNNISILKTIYLTNIILYDFAKFINKSGYNLHKIKFLDIKVKSIIITTIFFYAMTIELIKYKKKTSSEI